MDAAQGPLVGLKVLDLSRVLAGPYCTQMFADLGADVVKVEPPGGDETRRFGPPFVGEESTYFLSVNRGKRSVVLDLKHPAGQRVAQHLATWADVVVQNFRPGDADKLGVGYDTLHALNPRLVYVSISGYGQRGDATFGRLPGYDLVIQGVGGIAALTGPADGPPFKMGTSVADLVAGMNAFGGALAALYSRERTGEGRHVDISMQEGQLSMLTYHATAWLNANKAPGRLGNAHPSICPYETFAAQGGYINVACGNDNQFRALCRALELPELAQDEAFATNAARVKNRERLVVILGERLQGRTVEAWIERIGAAGVPCGPILSVEQALAHPQVAARGSIITQEHPTVGPVRAIASATGFEKPTYAVRPPPRLGEHTAEVLRDVLGLDETQVEATQRGGACGGVPL